MWRVGMATMMLGLLFSACAEPGPPPRPETLEVIDKIEGQGGNGPKWSVILKSNNRIDDLYVCPNLFYNLEVGDEVRGTWNKWSGWKITGWDAWSGNGIYCDVRYRREESQQQKDDDDDWLAILPAVWIMTR